MEIKLRENKNITILDITGEIDLQHANELRNMIKDLSDKGKINILINFKNAPYIDSSGIGVLVSKLNFLRKLKGDLKIMNLNDNVKRVFEFSKLDTLFQIFSNEENAIKTWQS
ncbi:MAG: STAS domain-containing protein [Spirochaetota bacterium]|nr:STAS domain-containing protein [Spirochaetota bacterium]